MISVVVNSRNEGEKLKSALSSVKDFADEIVVVDMESSDKTAKVAKSFGAKIYPHQPVDYIEPLRGFEESLASSEWVMILDPDEIMPEGLKKKLSRITREDVYDAVNIPRLNFIFGHKMKHTNFWPDRQIRFFKKGKIKFLKVIHSYPKVLGKLMDLPAAEELAIHHYPYQNVSQYWERMKRYSQIEAQNRFSLGERFSLFNLFYYPAYDFLRRFIRHLGFLDGWVGILVSFLQAIYYLMVEIKLSRILK